VCRRSGRSKARDGSFPLPWVSRPAPNSWRGSVPRSGMSGWRFVGPGRCRETSAEIRPSARNFGPSIVAAAVLQGMGVRQKPELPPGRGVAAVIVSSRSRRAGSPGARAGKGGGAGRAWVREAWRKTARLSNQCRSRARVNLAQHNSPGTQARLVVVAGERNRLAATSRWGLPFTAGQKPASVPRGLQTSEIIAPAGSDMQILPPDGGPHSRS